MDRGAWQATVHGVARVVYDLMTKYKIPSFFRKIPCVCVPAALVQQETELGNGTARFLPLGNLVWWRH